MVKLRILEILSEQEHTKYWLYKRMDMSYQNLSKLLSGQTSAIRLDTIDKLTTVLNCSIGELFIKTDEEENE